MKCYMGHFGSFDNSIFKMENFKRYYIITPELSEIYKKPLSNLTPEDLPHINARINAIDEYIQNNNFIIAKEKDLEALQNKRNDILDKIASVNKELNLIIHLNNSDDRFKIIFSYIAPSDIDRFAAEVAQSGTLISFSPVIHAYSTVEITRELMIKRRMELYYLNYMLLKELEMVNLDNLRNLISEAKKSNAILQEEREKLIKMRDSIESSIKPPVQTPISIPAQIELSPPQQNKISNEEPKKKRNYWWLLVVAGVGTYLYTKE
jgi:hypothetical protein